MKIDSFNTTDVDTGECKHPFNNPELYNLIAVPQYFFAQETIKEMEINPTDRILDIGCGDGKITLDLAKMASSGRVVGTDLSEDMIGFAKKTYLSPDRNNLEFMTMDAEKNAFTNQFDMVISFFCLQWVRNQLAVLKGIKNALVPGGRMVLTLPLVSEAEKLMGVIASGEKWGQYFTDFENPRVDFVPEVYARLLEEAGFEKRVLKEKVLPYEFDSQRDAELFLKACMPHVKKLPESKQDEFLADIASTWLRTGGSENKLDFSLTMLVVSAVKPS